MLGRILFIAVVLALVLLAIIFNTTVPAAIGPLGILFVFILMYVLVVGVLTFLIFGLSIIFRKSINVFVAARKPIQSLSLVRSYYFSSVIALGPIMLVGIHSVGELGFYDVLLVGIFLIVSCIYVAKRTH